MKKMSDWIQIILFLCFIGGLALAFLLKPDRDFSPVENRNLASLPAFSANALFSGAFAEAYETYVADQFPLRDGWTALKAWAEERSGKRENNGVYLCGDTLIERFELADGGRQFLSNLRAVDRFAGQVDVPVYLALIPTAAEIWRDRLPFGAPGCDQAALLEGLETQAIQADMLSALSAHADEAVFYRTDHHWTSLGACYGASALREAMGKPPVSPDQWTPQTVSSSFLGTLYSSSGVRRITPDSIEIYVPEDGVTVTSYENGQSRPGALYDREKLLQKDQYAMFLGGNQPLAVIRTGAKGDRLLMIRDSYADSEVPFLLDAFSEIHLVDLRYYRQDLKQYMEENDIDLVAISYGLKNFAEDQNVYFLSLSGR